MMSPVGSANGPCGLLVLNKPIGVTSRDAVDRVARPLRKIKVGHAGTLDPLASGVLVVCVGPATRLIEYVQAMPKTYRATIRLGATSDTLDADGQVVEAINPRPPTSDQVAEAISRQVGTFLQVPPQYSAKRVAGRRAYDLARAGHDVELAAHPVTIRRIDVLSYEWPLVVIEVECGGGTYIRSIARDVGESLGCGGLIEVLTRTRIGDFSIAQSLDPLTLTRQNIPGLLRPAIEAVSRMPQVAITAEDRVHILKGRAITGTGPGSGEVALIGPDGELVAIAEASPGLLAPKRVLASL